MKVQVYEASVQADETIRFRVLLAEGAHVSMAVRAAKEYLSKINHRGLSERSFQFQHLREPTKKELDTIKKKGYWIVKQSKNCP